MNNRFVVTGGPGAGKTTLLNCLAARGYHCLPESARTIIKHRLAAGMSPRPDSVSFAKQILDADIEKYQCSGHGDSPSFFDRSIVDALYMLSSENKIGDEEAAEFLHGFPYNEVVFLLPPWEQIYVNDTERDQTFEQAVKVFEGMKRWYQSCRYQTLELPKACVETKATFILKVIAELQANHGQGHHPGQ